MVVDIHYKEITIGSYVRYVNTGTKGIVKDIIKDKDMVWVLLDNNLMYRPYNLEVIELEDNKEKIYDEKEIVEEVLEKEKIEDLESNIDACGAG
ncbi:MAG TPA: DUF2098 domain-containing protein [Methanothermococcus okinawensis]|uniref:DUF2098 domain-containing protein n=1 Tax=Methanothermococcus okinawensis TaxID=155863 RepID=A0A832YSH4_9EURY|nr:DUF2098 domain-containing protein [Methanothermococcus okinawensis]